MPGRKPKPLQVQIAEGDPSKRGKNKLQESLALELQATGGLPPCPRHLRGRARNIWKFFSEELQVMNLDKRPDGPMLEGVCKAYERAVAADIIVAKQGIVIEKKALKDDGEVVVLGVMKHPAVEISNRCWLIVKSFCCEFGLTPVSRLRLSIEKRGDPEADLMKMLSEPRQRGDVSPVN